MKGAVSSVLKTEDSEAWAKLPSYRNVFKLQEITHERNLLS